MGLTLVAAVMGMSSGFASELSGIEKDFRDPPLAWKTVPL